MFSVTLPVGDTGGPPLNTDARETRLQKNEKNNKNKQAKSSKQTEKPIGMYFMQVPAKQIWHPGLTASSASNPMSLSDTCRGGWSHCSSLFF